jgi:hypothetical protein
MAIETRAVERSTIHTLEELLEEFPGIALPLLTVGTISLVDDTVAVSGSVSRGVVPTAELTINGHRVPVTELGIFCAVVRLEGQWELRLALETETHPRVALEVPLKAN